MPLNLRLFKAQPEAHAFWLHALSSMELEKELALQELERISAVLWTRIGELDLAGGPDTYLPAPAIDQTWQVVWGRPLVRWPVFACSSHQLTICTWKLCV